jgi:hypothetical protein
MNQTLKCYLHYYINHEQDNWIQLLLSAEYAYNQSVYSATGKTPFEIVLRYHPEFSIKPPSETPAQEEESEMARERATQLHNAINVGKNT